MVAPPYSLNTGTPGNSDVAANFPALDRSDKAIIQAWLSVQLDSNGFNTALVLDQIGVGLGLGVAPTISSGEAVMYYDTDNSIKVYKGTLGQLEYMQVPIGTVLSYAGSSAPNGFVLCAGQPISRTTFASLFSIIGTNYGSGDGSTTFNVPDLRGRVVAGLDNMGGTAAGRISASFTGTTLGASGGAENQAISQAQLPNCSFTVTDPGHAHSYTLSTPGLGFSGTSPAGGYTSSNSGSTTGTHTTGITVTSGGSGNPVTTMPPAMVMNKIIKY